MPPSPYDDLDRPPLDECALERALVRPGGLWRRIRVVDTTGSTNADLAELARAGEEPGLVLVAEAQTAGRGRMKRSWTAPPRSGLTFSVLLPAEGSPLQLGWLPLLAGVALVSALRGFRTSPLAAGSPASAGPPPEALAGGSRTSASPPAGALGGPLAEAALKWPNDVLVGDRKLAGILAERAGDGVVVGIGLNVSLRPEELPVPTATSLAIEGAPTDRDPLLRSILRELADRLWAFHADGTDDLRAAYKELCGTLGRTVRVLLPDETTLTGRAADVDDAGRLVVESDHGTHTLSAGDVVHVR